MRRKHTKERWKKTEINKLKKIYETYPTKQIKLLFKNRSWDSVKLKANSLGLKRQDTELRKGSVDYLLKDQYNTFYWMGFIMADGTVHKQQRLKVAVATKDGEHLERLAKRLKTTVRYYKINCELTIQDKKLMPIICEKFDLKTRKTYDPPLIRIKDFKKLIAWFVGFVDGDGSIVYQHKRKDCKLSIQIHSTWINVLQYMHQQICDTLKITIAKPKINTRGYAFWCIANHEVLRFLKRQTESLRLESMERKWDKII